MPSIPKATTVEPPTTSTVMRTNSMSVLDEKKKLGPNDYVSFRVVEDRDNESQHLRVNDNGELEVPYIGLVQAAGKSCKELAYTVKSALEREYYFHATVIIAVDHISEKSRGRVYVYGSVKGQGPQEIPADESYTVSKAIIRAGGFGDFANKRKVKVTRKGGQDFFLAVGEGFAQITAGRVAIMTDMAIKAENIDEAKAEEARRRAEARLGEKIDDEETARVSASLAQSVAQLRVKRRQHR